MKRYRPATCTTLPRRGRGRLSAQAEAVYQEKLRVFCRTITETKSTLDFEVSARGWCYILENKGIPPKATLTQPLN